MCADLLSAFIFAFPGKLSSHERDNYICVYEKEIVITCQI